MRHAERRVGEMAQGIAVRHAGVWWNLDHLHRDQFLGRIDPEVGAPDAAPVEAADGARQKAELRIGANGEAQAPAGPDARAHILAEHAGESHIGRKGVRRHPPYGIGREDARPVELAAIQQHLAEAQVIRRCRNQPATTGEQLCRPGDIP